MWSNPADARTHRARRVKQLAGDTGFTLARIATAQTLALEGERLRIWVAQGRQGEMCWFTPGHLDRSVDPERVLADARSVVSVGLSYWGGSRPHHAGHGAVARYAWGADYHQVMGVRLRTLAQQLQEEFGGEHRWYVDAGPTIDRAWAARSGLGWYGKNTSIITESHGSFVLLGELFTTLELQPDQPLKRDCGACRLCQVACPTGALGPDYSLDSRKCISYLTIEHRGPIPLELRPLMGAWVFGCDICQDVCPPAVGPYLMDAADRRRWGQSVRNELRQEARTEQFGGPPAPGNPLLASGARPSLDLRWLLTLTHEQYLEAFRGTAIRRAKVWMLRRNAAVALGNTGGVDDVMALGRSLTEDDHPVVRGHAAWALGHLATRLAVDTSPALRTAMRVEPVETVRAEIAQALVATPRPIP